ncbi:MAG: carbamoyltransferase HypF [candidate division Zixibacteria bacterium]|nr:carbamoyltransferase HypF [candidate division Zixibacteria bacterium]
MRQTDKQAEQSFRRYRALITGIVQGVGFRPFVFRLAEDLHLAGFVRNSENGVVVEIEGEVARLDLFASRIRSEAPPRADIQDCSWSVVPATLNSGFEILESTGGARATAMISPDIAVCPSCLAELLDPEDRRYRYPFINCTNCGPRFTIVDGVPYDRLSTSMASFKMCHDCRAEYEDPRNRRFHAQPNACPVCGPSLWAEQDGRTVATGDPVLWAVDLLRAGGILAVRGLGGFHLAVNAANTAAVTTLRERKGRAEKPFAVMVADVAAARAICEVDDSEVELLESVARPIVLLKKQKNTSVAQAVAPGQHCLGVMLPYTPLHHLLLQQGLSVLVMTSGNLSEEPIVIGNAEARERLRDLADAYLMHDREIRQRCDDSVVRIQRGHVRMIRRSRGYVPSPLQLPFATTQPILACGGELKNTIALARGNDVYLSQHIGDLDNPAAYAFFGHCIHQLEEILEIEPTVVVHDLHPEYLSTKWAVARKNVTLLGVQHHHAHLASVLAENCTTGRAVGIILDGTGYGPDGTVWGGEVLVGDCLSYERWAWLDPVPLPGGEAAIRQPWRMALSRLRAAGYSLEDVRSIPGLADIDDQALTIIWQMCQQRINSPMTSSCGRLFDAVSAMLGLCTEITYEAQAAIALEMAIESDESTACGRLQNQVAVGKLDVSHMITSVVDDLDTKTSVPRISTRFHRGVGDLFVDAAEAAAARHNLDTMALSGGVFQNSYLFDYMVGRLEAKGYRVLTHSRVPANDGGLALGQIAVAMAQLQQNER